MESRHLKVEIQGCQDQAFHLEQLQGRIDAIAELDIFLGVEGVDFVVLATHEETGDPQELEVGLLEELALVDEHEVDKLNTDVQAFLLDPELHPDLQQPLDEDLAHLGCDLDVPSELEALLQPSMELFVDADDMIINVIEVAFQVDILRDVEDQFGCFGLGLLDFDGVRMGQTVGGWQLGGRMLRFLGDRSISLVLFRRGQSVVLGLALATRVFVP